jgi:hypothetical protein
MQETKYPHLNIVYPVNDQTLPISHATQPFSKLGAITPMMSGLGDPLSSCHERSNKTFCGDRVVGGDIEEDLFEIGLGLPGYDHFSALNRLFPCSMMSATKSSTESTTV